MRLQLLSDLHLESEDFDPEPASGAEVLVLAGDIDSTWRGLERFAGWPVPVLFVAGNHEFDGRELPEAWPALRNHCDHLGLRLLERETLVLPDSSGRRIRFVATIRWCDFDLFGAAKRTKAQRAAAHFLRVMEATRNGRDFDAVQVRDEALECRDWLAGALKARDTNCDATVAITHYAPSVRSADPRHGLQPSTASFCNADDALIPFVQLWIHGHLHCRHDYRLNDDANSPRVVCNARGLSPRGEPNGYDGGYVIDV